MIFNNVNNLSVVDDFVAKYGNIIINEYPQLENLDIAIYKDTQLPYKLQFFDSDEDSPYMCNYSIKKIIRHENAYNNCGFLAEEEMAILAHELGHIIARHYGTESTEPLQKEFQADDFAIYLGLAEEMKSALQKMIDAGVRPASNDDMKKRIYEIRNKQASQPTTLI